MAIHIPIICYTVLIVTAIVALFLFRNIRSAIRFIVLAFVVVAIIAYTQLKDTDIGNFNAKHLLRELSSTVAPASVENSYTQTDSYADWLPLAPASNPFNSISPSAAALKAQWPLLATTNVEVWSPDYHIRTSDSNAQPSPRITLKREGDYAPVDAEKRVDFQAGSENFTVSIYTDIMGLTVNEEALKALIVGLAWSSYHDTDLSTMQNEFDIVVSAKQFVTTSVINQRLSPQTMLDDYFDDIDPMDRNTNGLTVVGRRDRRTILLAYGKDIKHWNTIAELTAYDQTVRCYRRVYANRTLVHELIHKAYDLLSEEHTTAASTAIVADLDRLIFDIK